MELFSDKMGYFYAAVEPGYNARRRARYAIRGRLKSLGRIVGTERVTVEPAPGYEHRPEWQDYEVWRTTEPYPEPSPPEVERMPEAAIRAKVVELLDARDPNQFLRWALGGVVYGAFEVETVPRMWWEEIRRRSPQVQSFWLAEHDFKADLN